MPHLRVRQTNRFVPSALAGLLLWLLLAGGIAAARGQSHVADSNPIPPTPGMAAAWSSAAEPSAVAPENPRYQAHVLMGRDFAESWSPADRVAAWNVGLPAPDVVTTTNVFALAPAHLPAPPLAEPQPAGGGGWQNVYRQSFDRGFPAAKFDGSCQVVTLSNHPRYRWGSGTRTTFNGTRGAASPALGIVESTGTYPEDALLQFACVFDGLQAAQNLMVQFALRLDRGSGGDTFFAGVSTDGQTFYGRRWRNTPPAPDGAADGPYAWANQRLFAPFIGGATDADGRVAVLWEFRSDAARTDAQGAWLDEIVVDQYAPRAGSFVCRDADPVMRVAGAPGGQPVSKGVNLPPYPVFTPSGLPGHVARLQQSGVQWVRLEWQARLDGVGALAGPAGLLNYIDLRHYDELLDLLCDPDHPIGVLGLLDYWTLPSQTWKRAGRIDDAYLEAMTAAADLLARYYGDRVGYWEIWNEPDFRLTYLAAGDYARLLTALSASIKQADPRAQIVFGGLGGADWVAAGYFRQVVQQLPTDPVLYDIFAIHPYPSHEFRRGGRLIRDPSYLRFDSPTVLERFMAIMRAAGHAPRPIWITEVGWNRAADSSNPATLRCQAIAETMVTGTEQAAFLPEQFDILFKEVLWEPDTPAVTKVFWYQYMDVGLEITDAGCWGGRGGGAVHVVDWWFGLYSGTDWAGGIFEPQPNPVECSFRAYGDAEALRRCLPAPEVAAAAGSDTP